LDGIWCFLIYNIVIIVIIVLLLFFTFLFYNFLRGTICFLDKLFWGNFWRFIFNSVNSTNFAILLKFSPIFQYLKIEKRTPNCNACNPYLACSSV
jgi:hypothetical protein